MPRLLPCLLLAVVVSLDAQVRPIYDTGASGLTQRLQRLTTIASALHTGAHPDDEDSAFMARTARGDHARVAYLSLNRGEGGQNIIGPELFDALGVIRTEELLQARTLDGGGQFFTRSFDYGFSKTRAEAATKWDEAALLEDMVRVLRSVRPLVIYSRFTGTAADGHGQHQMAGYLTPLAYRAAADPSAFPSLVAEGLHPWQARRLYVGARGAGSGPTLQLPTGDLDPALGRTYAGIAAEGRSQHKSQQMGTIEPLGPSASTLRLVEPLGSASPEVRTIFDGLEVGVPALGRAAGLPEGALRDELTAMDAAARDALRQYHPLDPAAILPRLADGLGATRAARAALQGVAAAPAARAHAAFLLQEKEQEFTAALLQAAGVIVDPLADRDTVESGRTFDVTVRTFAADPTRVRIAVSRLEVPDGWTVAAAPAAGGGAGPRRETPTHAASYRVAVPPTAPPTQPSFLARPRAGAMYAQSGSAAVLPFDRPRLQAAVEMEIAGVTVHAAEPVVYRTADPVRGELRRSVNVVPAVTIGFDSPLLIFRASAATRTQEVGLHVLNLGEGAAAGTLSLDVPAGWVVRPAAAPFTLARRDDRISVSFTVTRPASTRPGEYAITASASVGGRTFSDAMQLIAYPHIQSHRLYTPAAAKAQIVDLALPAVRVGYVMGTGDTVPDALRRMGATVTLLDDRALASGNLGQYDAIVVGIRASEARPAFAANVQRLRQYMDAGGTLVVQYQQPEYIAMGLAPYPAEMNGNSRVTDETAPVRILAPAHQAFTYPNRIGPADFDGWVQERNLYAFTAFDTRYTPLLESSDPGETPQRGAQVYARVGKGHYVYTSYAWFRQLPAGVPGAYRQFANLISLSKVPPRAGARGAGSAPRTAAVPVEADDRTRPSR